MNIALIPAKETSKRIPNKNFMDFCGRKLLYWTIRQALDSKSIDRVVVSSDRPMLKTILLSWFGDEYKKVDVLERPSELCQDNSTQEEVIQHAIEALKLNAEDNIVLLQPTSLLRLDGDIDKCIEQKAFSVNVEDDLYLWNTNDGITFKELPREKIEVYYRENGSIYSINCGEFREFDSRYGNFSMKHNYYQMQKWQQFEIDEPEDIEIVEYFFRRHILCQKV